MFSPLVQKQLKKITGLSASTNYYFKSVATNGVSPDGVSAVSSAISTAGSTPQPSLKTLVCLPFIIQGPMTSLERCQGQLLGLGLVLIITFHLLQLVLFTMLVEHLHKANNYLVICTREPLVPANVPIICSWE